MNLAIGLITPRYLNNTPMKKKTDSMFHEGYNLLKNSGASHLRLRLLITIVLTIAIPISSVLAPVIIGNTVNLLTPPSSPSITNAFLLGVLLYAVLATFSSVASNLRDIVFDRVIEGMKCRFSVSAFTHIFQLPYEFHSNKKSGSIFRIIDRGSRAWEELIRSVCFCFIPIAVEFLLSLAFLAHQLDWRFALIAGMGVFFYIAINRWADTRRIKLRRTQNDLDNQVAGLAQDGLTNFATVKILGAETRIVDRYAVEANLFAIASAKSSRILNIITVLQHSVMRICLAIIIMMAGLGVLSGEFQVGDVLTAILLIRSLFHPLGMLGYYYQSMQQATIDLEQALELKRKPIAFEQHSLNYFESYDINHIPTITLNGVFLEYPGRPRPVLNKLSLSFQAGKRTAIVGPSGGGKSSILHLIARLFDPTQGEIWVDDKNVKDIKMSFLRKYIAIIPQDISLFNDTLEMNLTVGHVGATPQDLSQAISAAELDELIEKLPMGLKTVVGERGVTLSGGERQRIGIARAILKKPKVLIMDEATSSLDGPTETAIQETLKKISKGLTTIIVAHRLSTIADADWIYVVKDGYLVQSGTHNELFAREGYYKSAWKRQIVLG